METTGSMPPVPGPSGCAPSYRTVKNILASAQDRLPLEDEPTTPAQGPSHENIRGGEYYAAQEEHKC